MEPGRLHLTGPEAVARCDENTIGVVAIMGSTFDGSYEPVAEIAGELDKLAAGGGPDVRIHVDAASGGFDRPVPAPGPRLGLPGAAGGLDQRLRAQVRPGVSRRRLGGLA